MLLHYKTSINNADTGFKRGQMRLNICWLWCLTLLFQLSIVLNESKADETSFSVVKLNLTSVDYAWLADRIYQNEANRNPKYLAYWSASEPFPSFGIGHFIWLPKTLEVPFTETFPQMAAYVSQFKPMPDWLAKLEPFNPPWRTRSLFYHPDAETQLAELRSWLAQTKVEQAQFIVLQLQHRLTVALAKLPVDTSKKLIQRLEILSRSKNGLFAIIDYYNFKGMGLNDQERYQGQGWGLLDVILSMPDNAITVRGFTVAGKQVLALRVGKAPEGKNESRWLKGWYKRLDGYLDND